MDKATRYSLGAVVESTSMREAILQFEASWLQDFWPPGEIIGDKAFNNDIFIDHIKEYGIKFSPIPPRRHSKNAIESKHRVIRDVFLRLEDAHPDVD